VALFGLPLDPGKFNVPLSLLLLWLEELEEMTPLEAEVVDLPESFV
jgi:hypothetical protein